MNIQKLFGENVLRMRLKLNLTQEKLSELANLNRTYIADIEKGKRNVSLQTVSKIAIAIECSVVDLLKENKNDKENICENRKDSS